MSESATSKIFDFRTHPLGCGDDAKMLELYRGDIQAAIDMGLVDEDEYGRLWITGEGIIWCAEQHQEGLSPIFESYVEQDSRGNFR